MNSYQILGVDKDASQEDIKHAYEDLKKMYDPLFNSSSSAYTRYRQIIKAYERIKNEQEREIYNLELGLESIKTNEERINEEIELFSYEKDIIKQDSLYLFERKPLLDKDIFLLSEVNKEKEKKSKEFIASLNQDLFDLVILVKVNYLDFLLGSTINVDYDEYVKCPSCIGRSLKCQLCNGIGKLHFEEDIIFCPNCQETGEVMVYACQDCNDVGFIKKKENREFKLQQTNLDKQEFSFSSLNKKGKTRLITYKFFCEDKNNYQIKDKVISIVYYLTQDELKNGLHKDYVTKEGHFKINIEPFSPNNYQVKYQLNNYLLNFTFKSDLYNGEDIYKYLLINEKDLFQKYYLNPSNLSYSSFASDGHFYEFMLDNSTKEINIKGFGEKGQNGGSNGDLIIKPLLTSQKLKKIDYANYSQVLLNTSRLFNFFGGREKNFFHFGFKRKNGYYLREKEKTIYILTGSSTSKRALKDYFLIRIFSSILWLILIGLFFLLPISKQNLTLTMSIIFGYAIIINVALNFKI